MASDNASGRVDALPLSVTVHDLRLSLREVLGRTIGRSSDRPRLPAEGGDDERHPCPPTPAGDTSPAPGLAHPSAGIPAAPGGATGVPAALPATAAGSASTGTAADLHATGWWLSAGAAPSPQGAGGLIAIIAVLSVLVLVVGAVAVVALVRDDGGSASAPKDGEVFLEAAADTGPDVFTTAAKVTPPSIAPVATTTPTTAKAGTTGAVSGGQPGLYGGTNKAGTCDATAIASYLSANPSKAKAWVDALNADPTLAWSGGSKVTTAQVGQYLSELTPVVLLRDTRVTNHGFKNGKATPRQAVLQSGTAVLVDQYGTPRVKCNCGNPLTKPVEQTTKVTYTGTQWPGFDPAVIVVVQPTTVVIETFVIVNVSAPVPSSSGLRGVTAATTSPRPRRPWRRPRRRSRRSTPPTFCSAIIELRQHHRLDREPRAGGPLTSPTSRPDRPDGDPRPTCSCLLSAVQDLAAGVDQHSSRPDGARRGGERRAVGAGELRVRPERLRPPAQPLWWPDGPRARPAALAPRRPRPRPQAHTGRAGRVRRRSRGCPSRARREPPPGGRRAPGTASTTRSRRPPTRRRRSTRGRRRARRTPRA